MYILFYLRMPTYTVKICILFAEYCVVDDPDSWPVECLYVDTEELVIPQVPENQPISSASTALLPSSTYSTSPSSPSSSMPPSSASVDKSLSPGNLAGPSSAKRKKTDTDILEVVQKDQQIIEHFLKQTLENDQKTIDLLQENNKLLAELIKK